MKPRLALGLMLLLLLPACTAGQYDGRTSDPAMTPTGKGTLALVHMQRQSGAFPYLADQDHVGITAIAGLAMLSSNDVAASSLKPRIQNAADFILRNQQKNGYLYHDGDASGMYGHAFALLFLTQVHATTTDAAFKAKVADAVKNAIKLTESGQSAQGGWRYEPTPKDADVSVTAAQIKALAAAKQQGFDVSQKTIDRGIAYLKSAQQPDGGFAYTLGSGGSAWPRSAAATAALLYAGVGGGDISKAISYLEKTDSTSHGSFYYGAYYLAQALKLGDPQKTKSLTELRAALLERQNRDNGTWSGEVGDAYATAMALIVLYTPTSNLPAFKGK